MAVFFSPPPIVSGSNSYIQYLLVLRKLQKSDNKVKAMASSLSPVANLCRRTATTRSASSCYTRRRFLLQHHQCHNVVQRRKFGVAIYNVANPKLDQIITQHHRQQRQQNRWLSSALQDSDSDSDENEDSNATITNNRYANHPCLPRLRSLRNVGVFAHVDAGKTTVTERMLALSGIVRNAGSVDDGDTVTDYLPAERERGIVSGMHMLCYVLLNIVVRIMCNLLLTSSLPIYL